MIKHIALFTLKDEANGNTRQQNIEQIRQNVQRLKHEIPVNKRVEVAEQLQRDRDVVWAADLAVCAEFDSLADYDAYVAHPVHIEAATFAASVSEHVKGITFESQFAFEPGEDLTVANGVTG